MLFFQWSIGMYSGVNWLKLSPHPVSNPVLSANSVTDLRAKFVADPFMTRENGLWWMFFETMPAEGGRGVIGLASSQDATHWTYCQTVLSEPFHLSYPHVFPWNGDWFMLPESAESRSVRLYRAREFPFRWDLDCELIPSALVDPTVFRHQEKWWMFASIGNSTLLLFQADNLRGPWLPHPANPVVKDNSMTARPAGRVLNYKNQLFRLGQDSIPFYGTRVRVFAIDQLSPLEYRETEVAMSPLLAATRKPAWNGFGMHHADIHQLEDGTFLACVDGSALARQPTRDQDCSHASRKICIVASGYDRRVADLAHRLAADSVKVHVMVIEKADRIDTQIRPVSVDGATLHRIRIDPSSPLSSEVANMVLWGLQTGIEFDRVYVLESSLMKDVNSAMGEESPRIVEEYGG